jgi:hypothetical protein
MTLLQNITLAFRRIAQEDNALRGLINGGVPDLSGLDTTTKDNLMEAVNELLVRIDDVVAGEFDPVLLKTALSLPANTITSLADKATHAELTSAIQIAIANLINGAPGALDTLIELGAALGNDANFAATVTNALATKVPTTRLVNGHPLSADVIVTPADMGLALVENIKLSTLTQWARNFEQIVVGTITRDSNDAITSAPVAWPDGTPGLFTADVLSSSFPGAVDAFHITYGSPVTKTFTQPAMTRNANGAVIALPAIVVT